VTYASAIHGFFVINLVLIQFLTNAMAEYGKTETPQIAVWTKENPGAAWIQSVYYVIALIVPKNSRFSRARACACAPLNFFRVRVRARAHLFKISRARACACASPKNFRVRVRARAHDSNFSRARARTGAHVRTRAHFFIFFRK
jgi:hypothetical protein